MFGETVEFKMKSPDVEAVQTISIAPKPGVNVI